MATQGNTSWNAVFPADAIIKIEEKSSAKIQTVTTQVTNFGEGGGGKDTESVAHFGNAFLVITKPQEDFEVSFDVSMKDTYWSQLVSTTTTAAAGTGGSSLRTVSGGAQNPFKIKIEWASGSNMYKIIYYDAYGVTLEKDNAADDRLTGTMSFTIAPTSAVGSGQKYEIETSNRYEAGIGSSLTGSYGSWEKTGDTLFGYSPGSMCI